MKDRIVAGALAIAGMLAGGAAADTALERIDRDGDGYISPEEIETYRGGRFQAWDLDRDGAVSRQEMNERIRDRIAEKIGRRFEELDTNGDGRIGQDEYRQQKGWSFSEIDRDGDGRISAEELRQVRPD